MGAQDIATTDNGDGGRRAMQRVLRDLDALEQMLERGMFETHPRRLGAEQELILVDRAYRPAPVADELLERVHDPRVVVEIARFNLEFNCDPVEIGPGCLDALAAQVVGLYNKVADVGAMIGVRPLMTGICPTVELGQLTRENISPRDRYYALDEVVKRLRGTDYELRIDGADELILRHPSVMLEAVNTSFQVHYQTTPDAFASDYNTALAVAAPLLAACVNSPILFGKRLWRETRIATFQQVVDTRGESAGKRDTLGRVRFGERWVDSSVLEIFRADVARFRQLLASDDDTDGDPLAVLADGGVPRLKALQAFNSCVYRWMRPCYGVTDGKPHLRIENRVLPAGPTIEDEIANTAFWVGLMVAGAEAWPDIPGRLDFQDARSNFLTAAREGLSSHMTWLDGAEHSTRELLLKEFVPVARRGLAAAGVSEGEAERTMGVIEARVASRRTGAHWVIDSVARMRGRGTRAQRLDSLARAMVEHQRSGAPVHEWPLAEMDNEGVLRTFATVSQCMTTDLFTVAEDECIDLVASIMDWEQLRHIPVETERHELVGLVSYRTLLRTLTRRRGEGPDDPIPVSEIMVREPVTVTPDTPTLDAIALMCERRVACLPVVEDGRLVGMLSERDYTHIARKLLERALREDADL